MKTIRLNHAAALCLLLTLVSACCREDPVGPEEEHPGPGEPQPTSLVGTKWHCHREVYDTILNYPIYFNEDTYREFLTDSTGYCIIFVNQVNQSVYNPPSVGIGDFGYTFDGEKHGYFFNIGEDSTSGNQFIYSKEAHVITVPDWTHPQYKQIYQPIDAMPEYDDEWVVSQ